MTLNPNFIRWLDHTFVPVSASATLRTKTRSYVLAAFAIILSLTLWLIPMVALGVRSMALIAEIFVVLLLALGLLFTAYTKNLMVSIHVFNTLGYIGGLGVQTALGGLQASGYVGIWFVLVPILTSATLNRRAALVWLGIFIAVTIGVVLVDAEVARLIPPAPRSFQILNSIANISVVSSIIAGVNLFLISQLDDARERTDNLLLNILPASIAERLKQKTNVIADGYSDVTVLFADIAGFTQLSANADPAEVVNFLNVIFSEFDELAQRHGLEKIKTIGDAYMVVGGLPEPREDHAEAILEMARDMLATLQRHRGWNGEVIHMRIGVNTGPVVAGVIGRQKFIYDLWGDAVNTASRMESNGLVDAIQVTESTYQKLRGLYHFEKRPPIFIKGKGEMVTYLAGERLTPAMP